MSTNYTKQTWTNGSAGATPISAARLGHLEDGIDAVDTAAIAAAAAAITTAAAAAIAKSLGTAKGDIVGFSASGTPVRVAVGATDGKVLQADSAQSAGVGYSTAAQCIIAPGTQAAPGLTSTTDTATGLAFPAVNQINFVVTGVNRVFIAATGITMSDGQNIILGTGTGTKIGTAGGQKLAFHNAAPVVQRSGAAQAAVAATAATNVTPYGYAQAQADAIVTLVNEIRATLVEKGIFKGSA